MLCPTDLLVWLQSLQVVSPLLRQQGLPGGNLGADVTAEYPPENIVCTQGLVQPVEGEEETD